MNKSLLQAFLAFGICLLVGTTVYVLAKARRLNFRYMVGWLMLCTVGVFASLGPSLLEPAAQTLGITTSALIGLIALLLLVLLAIQLSVSISGLQIQNRRLAEQVAILGHNIEPAANRPLRSDNRLDKTNVLILIPAFNEELNLGGVAREILGNGYQVLVIDDGSVDNTRDVAIECGVRILSLPFNLGVGGALKTGFRHACELGFLAVVQVDADGQHSVNEISNLLHEANTSDAHLVLGSRFRSPTNELKIGALRRLAMRILAISASRATGAYITDPTSGFRLIRQPLLSEFSKNFPVNYLGDTFEALISAGRTGYRVREIPAAMKHRMNGVSTATNVQAVKFIIKSVLVVVVRLHAPLKNYSENSPSGSQNNSKQS